MQAQIKSYGNGNRIEIWISPDGKETKATEGDGQENNLDFISTLEASDIFYLKPMGLNDLFLLLWNQTEKLKLLEGGGILQDRKMELTLVAGFFF